MSPTRAPEPTRVFFDPFNSPSTGHQRAENRLSGSTSWRDSRAHKLAHQFCDTSGRGGMAHVADLVGAGSENFGEDGTEDNRAWQVGTSGVREKGAQDIRRFMGVNKKRNLEAVGKDMGGVSKRRKMDFKNQVDNPVIRTKSPSLHPAASSQSPNRTFALRASAESEAAAQVVPTVPQIFRRLTLYLNGCTLDFGVSDHKLKSLFVQHGGSLSIALGRRTVTHVVLGATGGGLAAGKIQKEVAKKGGKGVKYVTAKWVVDSVECGKRLPENRYQAVHIAMKGQRSVLDRMSQMKQREGENGVMVEEEEEKKSALRREV
jgi:BRCT domain, a BRCA1 C-terminus domain